MRDGDETDGSVRSRGTLVWAIRTAGIAGFLGLAVTQYLARGHAGIPDAARVAQAGAGRTIADPETTGSIARGARLVRLDPCATSAGARAARP